MKLDDISFANIVENLYDGLYFVDRNQVITYWNKAAEHISGFSASEVIGRSCADNILTHIDTEGCCLCEAGCCPLAKTIRDRKPREAEIYMHHKDGHRIPVSVRASALLDVRGNVIGGVELFTDISNQRVNALRVYELEKLALLDNLTQLANRNYIEREFKNRFEELKRCGFSFGILLMDIDHFKEVNDTYGHNVGDKVLKFVAETLRRSARPFDLFGRWGGEEFIGFIQNVTCQELEDIANRLRLLIANAYVVDGKRKVNVTISIGATLVRGDDTLQRVYKRVDDLLYQCKSSGRNCMKTD